MPPLDTLMPPPKNPKKKSATPPAPPPVRQKRLTKMTTLTLGEECIADLRVIQVHLDAHPQIPGGRAATMTDAVRLAARQLADKIRKGDAT